MSLSVGMRLGPYEILAPLGAGGIGEVYRARDARLDRLVAIKVLRPNTASEPSARSRFDREARAIAALNHPRICTLYDVGHDQGTDYLVMELVEGETLAARLASGPLPVARAVSSAIQIAEALDFAHRRGLVHRDLKPQNVMDAKSGVKLLDFGIARSPHPETTAGDLPTDELTTPGALIGTLAYMAPEQLAGKHVDGRADIWAFGAMLFELVTGARPFNGSSPAETIASVLDKDPPEVSSLRPDTPPLVGAVIARCLMKDPDARWQSMSDVKTVLEWVGQTLAAASPTSRPARSREWLASSLTALSLAALAFVVVRSTASRSERPSASEEERVQIAAPATSDSFSLAISPDGRQLAFVVSEAQTSRLWLRSLATGTARPLDHTDGASTPFWAPTGASIGFIAGGQLKRLDLPSGVVQSLYAAAAWRGASWGRDDQIIFAPGSLEPLSRISSSGGEPVAATHLGSEFIGHRSPHFLPDGRHFVFYAFTRSSTGVYVSGPDMEPKRLFSSETDAIPLDDTHLLFVRDTTLFLQGFDPVRFEARGDPVPLAESVASDVGIAAVTASTSGTIAFRSGGRRFRQLQWFDRGGHPLGTVGAPDADSMLNPQLSADGQRIVLQRATRGTANYDLWTLDARGALMRLTSDPDQEWCPVWSPDQSRVAFTSNRRQGTFDLYQTGATAGAPQSALLESPLMKIPLDWSPDGRHLLYRTIDPRIGSDLYALPIDTSGKAGAPVPVATGPSDEREGQFSPDGLWVAYQSDESGHFEIYVQSFPGQSAKTRVSLTGGTQVRWNPNGKEIFFIGLDERLMAAPFTAGSGGQAIVGDATALFASHISTGAIPGANRQQYMVGAGGQRFLISVAAAATTDSPISLILHWKTPPGM